MTKERDTRAELLKTALNLIWSQSYGSVSVDDICRKAGAKKGSFYHYFQSKAELAKAALEQLWENLRPALDTVFSSQTDPLERIRQYALGTIQEQREMQKTLGYVVGCPFTSVGSEQCSCDDGLRCTCQQILLRFKRYLMGAIRDAVNDGSLPPIDPENAASQLLTYELGALAFARVTNDLKPLENLFDVWMGILLGDAKEASSPRRAQR